MCMYDENFSDLQFSLKQLSENSCSKDFPLLIKQWAAAFMNKNSFIKRAS